MSIEKKLDMDENDISNSQLNNVNNPFAVSIYNNFLRMIFYSGVHNLGGYKDCNTKFLGPIWECMTTLSENDIEKNKKDLSELSVLYNKGRDLTMSHLWSHPKYSGFDIDIGISKFREVLFVVRPKIEGLHRKLGHFSNFTPIFNNDILTKIYLNVSKKKFE